MGQLSQGQMREQAPAFAGAVAEASPLGDVYYVDSVNGADGNDGLSRRHPKATLANALAAASVGDTIVCQPGGSETLTATIAVSLAGVKIVCPTRNPQSGYVLTGAGTLDLMTISAANVFVRGLKFTRTAGAGSTAAGILTTAAADGLHVVGCAFDYSALTSAWTNYGIELVDDILNVRVEGCKFKDCHRGVFGNIATAKDAKDWTLKDCVFWVGRATAFGIHVLPAGTGTLQGLEIDECNFVEANGDGSAATDVWDGTDGTNAGSGPIALGAGVDRWLTVRCAAYTVAATLWENQQAINAGALGHHVEGFTHQGAALADVSSDTAHIESDSVLAESRLLRVLSDVSDILSDTTIATSDLVLVDSGVNVCQADLVIVKSDTTAIHLQTTTATSDLVIVDSGVNVWQADLVIVKSDTTAMHLQTTTIASDLVIVGSDLVLMRVGYPVAKNIVIADNAIPNNSQAAGGLICTATGGAVFIEEIHVAKDGTSLTGPTNLEITTDNAYGPTGTADPVSLEPIASLGGQGRYSAIADSTEKLPFVLESGKKLYVHGDNAAGTSLGNTQFSVIGRALVDGATLT